MIGIVTFDSCLAPSLALNAVVDFPIWISVIVVGGSAALYTSIVSANFCCANYKNLQV